MIKKMALCAGRHPIPDAVDGAIFPEIVNPVTPDALEATAVHAIQGTSALILYVTGLSVSLVAVINACIRNGVALILMHYDRDTGMYYRQRVITPHKCAGFGCTEMVTNGQIYCEYCATH